jgi:hypothetical protein
MIRMLPRISEGSVLANILEEAMYCGLSLGRVGVDFRGTVHQRNLVNRYRSIRRQKKLHSS